MHNPNLAVIDITQRSVNGTDDPVSGILFIADLNIRAVVETDRTLGAVQYLVVIRDNP